VDSPDPSAATVCLVETEGAVGSLDSNQVILRVEDLRVEFDTREGVVHAVNGVSYVLHKGESLAVVGESGCGKTVSALSIMRLLPQPISRIVAGRAYFNGLDLLSLSQSDMRRIRGRHMAMIYQDPMTSLNPVLTIGFQLMEPVRLHLGYTEAQARDRAIELLQLVGFPEAGQRLHDYPHQLSGGMRQRVMIAMALSCNPSLLIADEPTTALDVTIQAQIVELVKGLRDRFGMSLIWITHNLGLVAGLADRVLVMYAGQIAEEAPVEELYANARHPYTRALLRSLPSLDPDAEGELETIEGMPPDLLEEPEGCPFADRCEFWMEGCLEEYPTSHEVSPGHKVACCVHETDMRA
jgi:oligopeptide transport system ATP-binding protein